MNKFKSTSVCINCIYFANLGFQSHMHHSYYIPFSAYVHARLDVDDVERRGGPAGDPNRVRARHEAQARDRLREQVQRLQQLALQAPQPQLLVEAARHDPVQVYK